MPPQVKAVKLSSSPHRFKNWVVNSSKALVVPLASQVGLLKGYVEKTSEHFIQVRSYCREISIPAF